MPIYARNAWGRPTVRRPDLEEPEWDAHERSLMLALAYVEAHECAGCGGWLPETTDESADPLNKDRTHDWVAGYAARCHKCTALSQTREQFRDNTAAHALFFHAAKTERRRRATPTVGGPG